MLSNNLINCVYSGLSLERGLWLDIQEYMRKGWNKYFAPTGKMLNREGMGWINLKRGNYQNRGRRVLREVWQFTNCNCAHGNKVLFSIWNCA